MLVIAPVSPLVVILGTVPILVSPFAALESVLPLVSFHRARPIDCQAVRAWFEGFAPPIDFAEQDLNRCWLNERILLTAGLETRSIEWSPSGALYDHNQTAFPFCASQLALIAECSVTWVASHQDYRALWGISRPITV